MKNGSSTTEASLVFGPATNVTVERENGLALSHFENRRDLNRADILAGWEAVLDGCTIDVALDALLGTGSSIVEISVFLTDLRKALVGGWIECRLEAGGHIVAVLQTAGRLHADIFSPMVTDKELRLSRFSSLRANDGVWIAENPRAGHILKIFDVHCVGVLASFSSPRAAGIGDNLIKLALAAGIVVDEEGADAERIPPVAYWEEHEAHLHQRSRIGRNLYSLGATFKWRGRTPSLPVVKSPDLDRMRISLPKAVPLPAITVSNALETRRSQRDHTGRELSLQDISDFLWHSARVIEFIPRDDVGGLYYDASRRPYPCGGAAYELEIYLTLDLPGVIETGVWWYDPAAHALELRSNAAHIVRKMQMTASNSAAGNPLPQAVISLTSRIGRLAWKYDGISYAVTLKHVGVLYQTFYLVGTALDLACCGLGAGNSALVNAATETDPDEEAPVGDFIIGGRLPAGAR
jgi:hypothetical protein